MTDQCFHVKRSDFRNAKAHPIAVAANIKSAPLKKFAFSDVSNTLITMAVQIAMKALNDRKPKIAIRVILSQAFA